MSLRTSELSFKGAQSDHFSAASKDLLGYSKAQAIEYLKATPSTGRKTTNVLFKSETEWRDRNI